ncbi:MAG: nickel-dependent lactate racemase, partial [Phycisphaerae bacterium]|nr:nickel-dependent lactate racemase [Phycisphaerae bacterium]
MSGTRTVRMLYGRDGMGLSVPQSAVVLAGQNPPAVPDAPGAVAEALANPIDCRPLRELLAARRPGSVAITISDITRPVPNQEFLPALLAALNAAGIDDGRIVIIIGTGMHRPSTAAEREMLMGRELLRRVEVIDHRADAPETLVTVCGGASGGSKGEPIVRICRRFVEADFRIVTGYIEPHFMAGFSGGRKGVCPALVDLATIQRFHGYDTLANPKADNGVLDSNPCHEIALQVARAVGVDFLFNVAITRDRRIAGIYCGDLEAAHLTGCEQVGRWVSAGIDRPFDLVVTNGGGYPLDATFYQTVKGMCTATPALAKESTLLQVSCCDEQLGSRSYTDLMLRYDGDWRRFLRDIEANRHRTLVDQWEFQLQGRVLDRIGPDKLWFVSDGLDPETQRHIAVHPILGPGDAQSRAQKAIDDYLSQHPGARVAVIPDGPYTMLRA